MPGNNLNHLPIKVLQSLNKLREGKKEQFDLLDQISSIEEGKQFTHDFVLWTVINYSFAIIDGFCQMVEQRNELCAGALLRLQIDSILRLYALTLVDDFHGLLDALIKGKPWYKIKSIEGKPLRDKYLCEKASERFPWISSAYDAASGFVHLSKPHFDKVFNLNIKPQPGEKTTPIGSMNFENKDWPENTMIECIKTFTKATRCLFELSQGWYCTKQSAVKQPEEWDHLRKECFGPK